MRDTAAILFGAVQGDGDPSAATTPLERSDGSRPTVPRARAPEAKPGDQLGRYRLIEVLGAGGMGMVYRAHDPELSREVAVKVLLDARHDNESIMRFVREARAMARLSHPNVVPVYDVGRSDGVAFMAMELLTGGTLRQWIRERHTWQEVVEVLLAAGEGLAAAHHAGLVHRDFKPANVLLDESGRVAVADFGLARATGVDASASRPSAGGEAPTTELDDELTTAGMVMGTPRYMAPEQFRGVKVAEAADQFSFCAVLYEALYGQPAIPGRTMVELREAALSGAIMPPPPDRPVPSWLRALVERGLSLSPDDRFANMDALLAALRRGSRPQRLGLWLGTTGLVAASAIGLWTMWPDDGPACEDANLGEAWDQTRRDAVTRAFTESTRPYRDETLGAVQSRLDGYAGEWQAAHGEACATQRAEPGLVADARLACLRARQQELAALTEALAAAENPLVDRAMLAVDSLPTVATCDEADSMPDDPELQAALAVAAGDLSRARVAIIAGQDEQALTAAQTVATLVRELPTHPSAIEAAYLAGVALTELQRFEAAEKQLSAAYTGAVEAKHEVLAARSASAMLTVIGTTQGRYDDAETWIRYAEAAVARAGYPRTEHFDLLDRQAALRKSAGRFEEALALRREALALAEQDQERHFDNFATVKSNMSNDLRTLGRLDEAQVLADEALEIRRRELGADHPAVAESLHNLSILASMRGRFREAEAHLRRVIEIHERLVGPNSVQLVAALGNLANVVNQQDRHEDALRIYDRAIAIVEKVHGRDDLRLCAPLGNSSNALNALGRHDEAEARLRRSLRIETDALGADHVGVAHSRLSLADTLADLDRIDEALTLTEQALPVILARHGPDHPYAGLAFLMRGELHAKAGRTKAATVDLEKAIDTMERAEYDANEIGNARFLLARVLYREPTSQARALELAHAAADAYRNTESGAPNDVAAVEAWLASPTPLPG